MVLLGSKINQTVVGPPAKTHIYSFHQVSEREIDIVMEERTKREKERKKKKVRDICLDSDSFHTIYIYI